MKPHRSMISILAIAMIFISFVGNAQPDTLKLASIKEKSMAISNRMERDLSLSATPNSTDNAIGSRAI